MKVFRFPLTRITIFFVFGILYANYFPIEPSVVFLLLLFAFVTLLALHFRANKKHNSTPLFGISALIFSFFIGSLSLVIHSGWHQKNHFITLVKTSEESYQLDVILREKLKSTANFRRYIALVNHLDSQSCSGKIIVHLDKKRFASDLPIGTELHIESRIFKHKQPLNPDQFDYGNYLARKSILAQTFVKNDEVKVNTILKKDVFYYADALRTRIITNLQKNEFKPDELNVLAALILGQQQDINPEIVTDYQLAGAVHILSVSGLHVGFIVLFLGFLLKFIPNKTHTRFIKLVITLAVLWFFAILAGLSPSVIRSVTMFSFLAIGIHMKRTTAIFHTLLVSLFLILLIEPAFLFDVGFQLSYVALFFILWLQPTLDGYWKPKNRIVLYFWNILTVSFAAQIGTFPLSIYYFHQFPGLFFITNLVVIPFLSLIMGLGVIVMILAVPNLVPPLISNLLEWFIAYLNKFIHLVASYDMFIFKDISFNNALLLSLYLLIISVVVFIKRPRYQMAFFVLISILWFQGTNFRNRWVAQTKSEWIVFDQRKETVIIERNGKEVTVMSSDSLKNRKMINSYLVANFCHLKAEKSVTNLSYFASKKILVIDSLGNYPKGEEPDIMVLIQSPKINLERVFSECKPKLVIADASSYKSYKELWEATCLKQKIPFHNTSEEGFYRLEN